MTIVEQVDRAEGAAQGTDPLVAARAGVELAKRRLLKAAVSAERAGRTQREIADRLNLSQARVNGLLVSSRHRPAAWDRTPYEVCLTYAAREIDHQQLLDTLLDWPWTVSHFLDIETNPLPEQWVRGDWEDLVQATDAALISDADYEQLFTHFAAQPGPAPLVPRP